MRKIVLIPCNDFYVPKSIVALSQFCSLNSNYDKAIIGTKFNDKNKELCQEYNIKYYEVDLSNDFNDLDKRPYGRNYPLECFYHFYGYKAFSDYDFIIKIEPDIFTNNKIDIDLNDVEYIGGSYSKHDYIGNFGAIINDYNEIKKVYKNGNIKQHRIIGGVNIYNVKNLEKINFYEKIVEYYKTSIEIGKPRCGDDSLMVLYQLLNEKHIKLLKPSFHEQVQMNNYSVENLDKTIFLHSVCKNDKYWNINNVNRLNTKRKFIYDNMVEYIYNNFSNEFIKKYIPNIYKNIDNVKIPFYYYNKEDNFGDFIIPYLLNNFCDKKDYSYDFNDSNNPKIISCGSIMRLCNENSIVYGSGIRDINQNIKKGIIKIVRGPLTRNRLLQIGCYCHNIYGDPGLLLPLYYNPNIKKTHKLGIIPHIIHYNKVKEMYKNNKDIKIINLRTRNIEYIVDEILSCEKTISSSLHGLITSDAYNIPNKWVKFDNNINGDDTKFYDYFLSVKRNDTKFIDCMNFKHIPKNTYDKIGKVSIDFDVERLNQRFFMNKDGIKNYTKYLYKTIMSKNINLKKNEWFVYKDHWIKNNRILTSIENTYIKKKITKSKDLNSNDKLKINIGDKIKFVNYYDDDYFIGSI